MYTLKLGFVFNRGGLSLFKPLLIFLRFWLVSIVFTFLLCTSFNETKHSIIHSELPSNWFVERFCYESIPHSSVSIIGCIYQNPIHLLMIMDEVQGHKTTKSLSYGLTDSLTRMVVIIVCIIMVSWVDGSYGRFSTETTTSGRHLPYISCWPLRLCIDIVKKDPPMDGGEWPSPILVHQAFLFLFLFWLCNLFLSLRED